MNEEESRINQEIYPSPPFYSSYKPHSKVMNSELAELTHASMLTDPAFAAVDLSSSDTAQPLQVIQKEDFGAVLLGKYEGSTPTAKLLSAVRGVQRNQIECHNYLKRSGEWKLMKRKEKDAVRMFKQLLTETNVFRLRLSSKYVLKRLRRSPSLRFDLNEIESILVNMISSTDDRQRVLSALKLFAEKRFASLMQKLQSKSSTRYRQFEYKLYEEPTDGGEGVDSKPIPLGKLYELLQPQQK